MSIVKNREKIKYYIGVDVGTNSVGWAVTNPQYNICKFNQKSMWGIRLFESANTAADRRMKRANRRRLQRRVQRINLLQDLFKEERGIKAPRYQYVSARDGAHPERSRESRRPVPDYRRAVKEHERGF